MRKEDAFIDEIKHLVKAYGANVIADLLDTTERGMQYWTASEERKVPREATQRKIHELFMKHSNGEDLTLLKSDNADYKDKYIASIEKENTRLNRDLELSLGELRHNILMTRAMAETNQNLLIELLAKQRKVSVAAVVEDANKLFAVSYKRMKEEGSFAHVGK